MAKYDVAGIGNAIVDVIAAIDDAFLLQHSVAKGVMSLVDEFRVGELLPALTAPQQIAGGSAANTMAGIASFGGKGLFVGKVKDDVLGRAFADSMNEIGVTFSTAMATDGPSTASSVILVTPDKHRSMNTYLGASREIGVADVDEAAIAASAVLYIEGYLWDQPDAKAAIAKAIAAAKRAGGKVAFTLSDPFCVGRYREEFLGLLKNDLDILFANEDEAKALFEVETFDAVLPLLKNWGGIAAVTRSQKGCVVVHGSAVHVIGAVPGVTVIDTTGAGDQFAAGFLYGHTHGLDLATCGKLGALAAAEVISHYGARPEKSLRDLAARTELI
ncbi:MAG TPA: adenosine kinase [Rhizomicrobium sp.]|jgi:sugar/nucleoside kinase (ribokinase family)